MTDGDKNLKYMKLNMKFRNTKTIKMNTMVEMLTGLRLWYYMLRGVLNLLDNKFI